MFAFHTNEFDWFGAKKMPSPEQLPMEAVPSPHSVFHHMPPPSSESNLNQVASAPEIETNSNNQIVHNSTSALSLATNNSSHDSGSSHNADDDGLWIRLHNNHVILNAAVPGKHFPNIHPNCHAPTSFTNVHVLRGGGSGTAVFAGHSDVAGDVVMKHGGFRDTLEVFSLAEIAAQLQQRGATSKDALEAATFMRSRIPEFVGVYCSPFHLRDRGQESWMNTIRKGSALGSMVHRMLANRDGTTTIDSQSSDSDGEIEIIDNTAEASDPLVRKDNSLTRKNPPGKHVSFGNRRKIRLCRSNSKEVQLDVFFRSVLFCIPHLNAEQNGLTEGDYDVLRSLATELAEEQQLNAWKVTLMQKTIGGPNAVNGAEILTSGRLQGELLDKVIAEFTTIIHHLQKLTHSDETPGLQNARAEYQVLRKSRNVKDISKATNDFCGSALRKNYLPDTGRFAKLRQYGQVFRQRDCMLEPAERFPATFLGALLQPNVLLSTIFHSPVTEVSALDRLDGDAWLDVLESATCFGDDQPPATNCIWTCGLTDAGLHNTFLSQTRGLELFDLGKPQLMPIPAFLTKFLMSYFHALGMQDVEDTEGEDDGVTRYTWARRFQTKGGRLIVTPETQELLPEIYAAFLKTLDHFIVNVFNGEERVRRLLIQYVVLQLLSDGAFCLMRWEEKGGGRERFGKHAKVTLHKWLWRSIWDIYIASEVYEKLFLQEEPTL